MKRLGRLFRGEVPRIAVSFDDTDSDDRATWARDAGVDIAELRVDRYSSFEPEHVVSEARKFADLPTLGTIRVRSEGGHWSGSERIRLDLFRALLDVVDGVDVELAAEEILPEVVAAVRSRADGQIVVVSHHDFDATPPTAELESLTRRAKEHGADYVKISTMANGPDDVRRLAAFTAANAESGLIVIAMGTQGTMSRVFFPALGSRITYSYLGTESAPGQLSFAETAELFRKFYPQYDHET